MDANGLRFWMLSTREDWVPAQPADPQSGTYYCAKNSRLQLRSTPDAPPPAESFVLAKDLVEAAPFARDPFGNYARWDPASGHVMAGGSGTGEVPIYTPPALTPVTDLALGFDGVLYIAVGGDLVFVDRKDRWPDFSFPHAADVTFWRLAAHPGGGVLALDRDHHQLVRVEGLPLGDIPACPKAPGVMAACEDNQDPPRVSARLSLPADEAFVALADDGNGTFVLLSWDKFEAANQNSWLRVVTDLVALPTRRHLAGAQFPYSIAWLENRRVAVLATQNRKALIYAMDEKRAELSPSGDSYVLSAVNAGPFAHGFSQPPNYNQGNELYPLLPLSLNSLASKGSATGQRPFDSAQSRTVWHRLYLEAKLPPRSSVIVWLAASDDPGPLSDPNRANDPTLWFPHLFGDATAGFPDAPRAVWLRQPSEVPFHPGLLGDAPQKERSGLFMVLVQRANVAVRALRGRYLAVRVELAGDGRSTPEIAALRVYGPRFSYVERYLPEIYREDTFGPEADLPGAATAPDFFERFVDLFEAPLTQAEDRIAAAYLLTNPQSAPDDGLDWLGSWVGVEPEPEPPDRRRARIHASPKLYRERGTVRGIERAIDLATAGMHQRGAVIVLEDYRLRHTFATVLGANLAPKDDPLLPGYWESSNSFVGDTLFLGDEHHAEFLSLYQQAIATPQEQAQVDAFFANLAHRMTVFVHDQVETVAMQLVKRVVEREKPAHVAVNYLRASLAFMIGLASLVGVNTYLTPPPPRQLARVNQSAIGRYAFIGHDASLDPRMHDPAAAPHDKPIAKLQGPGVIRQADSIALDASNSTASPGSAIRNYLWTLISGPN